MFENIGWGEILVLVIAGLFILGPERLPSAARWMGKTMRQIKDYATGARDQLRNELGPEFDEIRKPLEDLNRLRGLNPRTAITQHLFGDEEPFSSNGSSSTNYPASTGYTPPPSPPQRPLEHGERPPYDPDAT